MTTQPSASQRDKIRDNWLSTCDDVATACHAVGRDPESVMILGVAKYVDAGMTAALFEAGCLHIGENRPQQLWEKADELKELPIHWHQIGHLQRNKVKRTISIIDLLHAIDSERLAKCVSEFAVGQGLHQRCLLEVNISGDQDKHGFSPDNAPFVIDQLALLPGLEICGLMGMASIQRTGDAARPDFQRLRELRDSIQQSTSAELVDLSMGMSGDYQAAIAEGATIVRIGTRLFEGVR